MWFGGSLIRTVSVPPGGAVTVVVVAYDCDQYSVVVTVWFGGSLIITVSVPPGGAVTVVVVARTVTNIQ